MSSESILTGAAHLHNRGARCVDHAIDMERLDACFPYQVLSVEAPVRAFDDFLGL